MRPDGKFRLTPSALSDLTEVRSTSLASFGASRTKRLLDDFHTAFARIAKFPYSGRSYDEVRMPGLRVVLHESFLIAYRPTDTEIQIVGVLHGRRDLQQLLADRSRIA